MALALGTNAGFVTEAPEDDPEGTNLGFDIYARVTKDVSPVGAGKITEMGWWCDGSSEETNFEVGLYAADGEVAPGEAGTLLEVERTNAKGTTAGWKRVTGLNWSISAETSYWLGVQVDNTVTISNGNYVASGGYGRDNRGGLTTLPNPFGGGTFVANAILGIYAVWEEGVAGTNIQINVDDAWKEVSAIKVNVDDAWKAVAAAKVNVDDTWKTIF